MRRLGCQLLLLLLHRRASRQLPDCHSSCVAAAGASGLGTASYMQALGACSTPPLHRAGQQPPATLSDARLAARQQPSPAQQAAGSGWHAAAAPLYLLNQGHRAVQCWAAGARTRKAARRGLHSSAGHALAPGADTELDGAGHSGMQQHQQQQQQEHGGWHTQLHLAAAGEGVPGLLTHDCAPLVLQPGMQEAGQQPEQQQQQQQQQQHPQVAAELSEQQVRDLGLPQEVLLVGIDPDCGGAIAVVRSPLVWSLQPPATSSSSSSSSNGSGGAEGCAAGSNGNGSKRSRAKKSDRAGSSGDSDHAAQCTNGSNSTTTTTSSSSSTDSNGSSSSTAEVLHLQAFMGLPAAVYVYDMPVETIVIKTKTSTGKRRVRRRLDILQAMAIVRQVLQDAAETADAPPGSSVTAADDTATAAAASPNTPAVRCDPDTSSNDAGSSDGPDTAAQEDDATSASNAPDTTTSSSNGSHPTGSSGSSDPSTATTSSAAAAAHDSTDPASPHSSSSTGGSVGEGRVLLRAVVEVASLLPSNGSLATLNQGYSVGAWTALLASHGFDVTTVHVLSWKKDLGLLRQDKDASRVLARALYKEAGAPQDRLLTTKNTHGRAEALLLAAWGLGWSAAAGARAPSLGPLRATVHMDGGRHSLPLQQQQQQQVLLPESPSAAATAAGGVTSDDESGSHLLCNPRGLAGAAAAAGSMLGVVTRSHIAQRLQPLAGPAGLQQQQQQRPPKILDVGAAMDEAAAAVKAAAAAKQAEKEQRAAERKQAAADRAAAREREKQERAAARARAAEERAAEKQRKEQERAAARAAKAAAARGKTAGPADEQAAGDGAGEAAPSRRRSRKSTAGQRQIDS